MVESQRLIAIYTARAKLHNAQHPAPAAPAPATPAAPAVAPAPAPAAGAGKAAGGKAAGGKGKQAGKELRPQQPAAATAVSAA